MTHPDIISHLHAKTHYSHLGLELLIHGACGVVTALGANVTSPAAVRENAIIASGTTHDIYAGLAGFVKARIDDVLQEICGTSTECHAV